MPLVLLSPIPADWERHFDRSTLAMGRSIQFAGKVLRCTSAADCPGILAQVQSSNIQKYSVDIIWSDVDDVESFVEGECSCLEGFNCKHVVAAILEAFANIGSKEVIRPASKLSAQARSWLEELHQAAAPPEKELTEPGAEPERLVYVLKFETTGYGASKSSRPQLGVHLYVVRKLQGGTYGQGAHCAP